MIFCCNTTSSQLLQTIQSGRCNCIYQHDISMSYYLRPISQVVKNDLQLLMGHIFVSNGVKFRFSLFEWHHHRLIFSSIDFHAVSGRPSCVKGILKMTYISVFDLICNCDVITVGLLVYPHSIFSFYFVYDHYEAQRTKLWTLWNSTFHSPPRWHFVSNFDPLLFLVKEAVQPRNQYRML